MMLFMLHIVSFTVRAEYILPYPGPMPGNKLRILMKILDAFQYYWHWGNIAKVHYYTELSDKYLVEAKTLFEYKQYILAVNALKRSNQYWVEIQRYIDAAKSEGKDVTELYKRHREQAVTHATVIEQLIDYLPKSFVWQDEKKDPILLSLRSILEEAKHIRQ